MKKRKKNKISYNFSYGIISPSTLQSLNSWRKTHMTHYQIYDYNMERYEKTEKIWIQTHLVSLLLLTLHFRKILYDGVPKYSCLWGSIDLMVITCQLIMVCFFNLPTFFTPNLLSTVRSKIQTLNLTMRVN